MSPRLVWAIAPTIIACAALLATFQVTREVDANAYLTVAKNWSGLDSATQQELAAMVEDGKLTSWEWVHGVRIILDRRGLLLGTLGDDEDIEAARSKVLSLAEESRINGSDD